MVETCMVMGTTVHFTGAPCVSESTLHGRDLHGNGDNGNTAVMEATAAVIPR